MPFGKALTAAFHVQHAVSPNREHTFTIQDQTIVRKIADLEKLGVFARVIESDGAGRNGSVRSY